MVEIKSLSGVSFDELFEAFEQAFADYEVQLNKAEHHKMLKRRGFDPDLSFAAFDAGKIVSFTCNGIGYFYGMPTAYDTGTGTLKEYRGMGLATRIFEYSIPYLKQAGIREYLLEVLQHNTGAVSVYRKLGFEVTREFNYFRANNKDVRNEVKSLDFPYTLQAVDVDEYDLAAGFWDFRPSWQNSFESVGRAPEEFVSLGVFTDGTLVGYGIFEPATGDLTQIAVDRQYRRRGVGSLLLHNLLVSNTHDSVKVINTAVDCHSIDAFLSAKNIGPAGKQFEMVKKL